MNVIRNLMSTKSLEVVDDYSLEALNAVKKVIKK
jgi:hypothetical protein